MKAPTTKEEILQFPVYTYKKRLQELTSILKSLFGITIFEFSRWHITKGILHPLFHVDHSEHLINYWLDQQFQAGFKFTFDTIGFKDHACLVIGDEVEPISSAEKIFLKWRKTHNKLTTGIYCIEPQSDFVDIYRFSSDKTDKPANLVLKHLDELKKFKQLFVKEMQEVINDPRHYFSHEIFTLFDSQSSIREILKRVRLNEYSKKLSEKSLGVNKSFITTFEYPIDSNITLSFMEKNCLYGIAQGQSAKEIAKIYGISSRTVEKHLSSVRSKLNVVKTIQAINKSRNMGLLEDTEK